MGQLGEGVLGWRRTAAESLFIVITSYINIVISYSSLEKASVRQKALQFLHPLIYIFLIKNLRERKFSKMSYIIVLYICSASNLPGGVQEFVGGFQVVEGHLHAIFYSLYAFTPWSVHDITSYIVVLYIS